MVASSEQQRAPVIVNKPATAHPRSNQPGAPLSRDDSAEVMKMPEPIIDPITIMVASIGPSARTRPDFCGRSLISKNPAREQSRALFRDAISEHAQNLPRPAYRREGKLFPREHRHPHCRPIELCFRATFELPARQLLPDHAAKRLLASEEQASHRSN